jgi:hypothetical protein
VRFEREIPLVGSADAAWGVLSTLPPARGSAAGYEGVAVVEDADDDARVATVRLVGSAGAASVAATAAVTVLEGRLNLVAELHEGPGGPPLDEEEADDALGHLATTLAYALAIASRPRRAWDRAVPPTPTTADAWDTPSPPPAPPARTPIPADATLKTTILPAEAAALVPATPHEVLTPRPHDEVHPGEEAATEEHRRPWVKAGLAAAAGLAVLRIVRGRR